jgi:DNA replication protein DnaC
MSIRAEIARRQQSGLSKLMKKYTFQNYKADEPWQLNIAKGACDYVRKPEGWFFIGGQPGSGKTHICTAICGELLKQNLSIKYMSWSEESVKLKGKVNDDDFDDLIRQYKDVDVLYIDDFFKTRRSRTGEVQYPSDADIKLAYQIINFRYTANKKTIISSEWILDELMNFDDATSSRIYEMCRGGSMLQIDRLTERNYRMRFAV